DRARTLRPRARLAGGARFRDPGRRPRDRARRAAPPRAAQLRGDRRGLGWRPAGGRAAGQGAGAVKGRDWGLGIGDSGKRAPRITARSGARADAPSNPESRTRNPGITPTLAELVALRAAAQGRRPPRRGRHGVSGQAPSPLRGRGMEYAESREYAIGDDARHIDWRLTARSGKPHTKLFQAERERLTLLVADTAPALYFGTRVRFKSVQAARAGAVAAWAAVRDGDRIAALRGSTSEPPVPPAAGPRGALRVLDALVRWYSQPPADDGGLALALDHAGRLLRPGSRMVVLADAASVAAVPASRWPALSMHSEVIVLLL